MLSESSRVILPQPPVELKQLSEHLEQRIASQIRERGPIPFSQYMEMALYEPGLGYYSAGLRKFGEDGDFVTAPELGSVFARCLARQIEQISAALEDYIILEVGAGTGRLASDLLIALEDTNAPSRYLILERSADLRKLQYESLKAANPNWLERIEWIDEPPAEPWHGVLIANEVIDALPVERFCIDSGQVQQFQVSLEDKQLSWHLAAAPAALDASVRQLFGERLEDLAQGYSSEICLMMKPWLQGLCAGMERGCAIFIDYGYPQREYYSAQRSMGTLICHYRHRGHDDPFLFPGLQDISAFVDFTALALAADQCDLECSGYTSQAMFLLGCGLEQILNELEHISARERMVMAGEIRELTLPGAMGEKFQVMALSRGIDSPGDDLDLRGFELRDLRYRL